MATLLVGCSCIKVLGESRLLLILVYSLSNLVSCIVSLKFLQNKKQRQIVREAVLRMKDVGQMLKEIEEIEEQELKNFGQMQFNEKGLEEKKSKLHASIHRVARYYVSHMLHISTVTTSSLTIATRGPQEGSRIEAVGPSLNSGGTLHIST